MNSEKLELYPEFHLKVNYSPKTYELSTKVFRDEVRVKIDESTNFEFFFQNKNGLAELDIDALTLRLIQSMNSMVIIGTVILTRFNAIHKLLKSDTRKP